MIKNFLWAIPLPLYVFGSVFLVATANVYAWMDADLIMTILVYLPIPLLLTLERFLPKRKDWLLNWRDFTEDTFWVSATYLIWFPIYSDHYKTPISEAFKSLREMSEFPYTLESSSVFGMIICALIGIFAIEFISYWLHRMQHRFMFFWRMHATHHHITKMSAARADRTHPLEFLGLTLGSAVALAFLGASDEVVGLVILFRTTIAYSCHSNLPLRSGLFGWLFNTPEWHQLHHSCNYKESNTNYGCTMIIWDRVFGTFSNKNNIEKIGNGTGEQLTLLTQLIIPFLSDKNIRKL